jgi:hypothetical protein
MKKLSTLVILLLVFACSQSALARVRLYNATGQKLVVDLLSEQGREEGIELAPFQMTDVLGPRAIGDDEPEMLVIRDANGKELGRDKVFAGNFCIVKWHGDEVSPSTYRSFKRFSPIGVDIISNTGVRVDFEYEKPDFSIDKAVVSKPNSRDKSQWTHLHGFTEGQKTKVKVTSAAFDGPQTVEMRGGGFYILDVVNGQLKFTEVQ